MLTALIIQHRLLLLAAGIIFAVYVYRYKYDDYLLKFEKYYYNIGPEEKLVFSKERLAKYNGVEHKKLYLALLGTIFDVTSGIKHYSPGAAYNYFVGKDGSRAFITGKFDDDKYNTHKDHVLDFKCIELLHLYQWRDTLKDKYPVVGVLHGRYYTEEGKETGYHMDLQDAIEECIENQKVERLLQQRYPPCNAMWDEDVGSRVWCSMSSGGVDRNWIGVPRQIYEVGSKKSKCVCVDLSKETDLSRFKTYDGCPERATYCGIFK